MAGYAGGVDAWPGNQHPGDRSLGPTRGLRLVQKGALKTTQQGRAFIYTPLIPEQDSMDQAVDQLFDAMCQMRAGKTIIHLLERSVLSQKDIATMQAILTEKAKTAPE